MRERESEELFVVEWSSYFLAVSLELLLVLQNHGHPHAAVGPPEAVGVGIVWVIGPITVGPAFFVVI